MIHIVNLHIISKIRILVYILKKLEQFVNNPINPNEYFIGNETNKYVNFLFLAKILS